jgi:hypothetical protein
MTNTSQGPQELLPCQRAWLRHRRTGTVQAMPELPGRRRSARALRLSNTLLPAQETHRLL